MTSRFFGFNVSVIVATNGQFRRIEKVGALLVREALELAMVSLKRKNTF